MRAANLRGALAISLGAIAGSLLRYYFTLGIGQWLGTAFLGTFFVNLTGAFGMGFFVTWLLRKTQLSPELRLMMTVGFFGAYTTFSTYELDAETLLSDRHLFTTLLYWICTATLGVVCLEAGSILGKKLS